MKEITALLKKIQEQKETYDKLTGIGRSSAMAAVIEAAGKAKGQYERTYKIPNVASALSQQMKKSYGISWLLNAQTQSKLAKFSLEDQPIPRTITSKLFQISKYNPILTGKLSDFINSQYRVSKGMGAFASLINQPHLRLFNGFDMALNAVSKKQVKDLALEEDYDEISILEEANNAIAQIAETVTAQTTSILETMHRFQEAVEIKLSEIANKPKKEKTKNLILEWIAIIGFLISIYATVIAVDDISNKETIELVKKENERHAELQDQKIAEKIDEAFGRLAQTRFARVHCNLLEEPRKNAKSIGRIKIGQQVTVLNIQGKYLLIAYVDQADNKAKSGFVLKKYFEVEA